MYKIIPLLVFFLNSSLQSSEFPKILGCFCEGGLIFGKVKSKDNLEINNKKMKIFEDGSFIYAFGIKHTNEISVIFNGKKKNFKVKKKKYKIENISGLPSRKVEPNKKDLLKIKNDRQKISVAKKIGKTEKLFEDHFQMPAKGRLSGVFGSQRILNNKPRSPHKGIDIAAPEGTKILSPSSGTVKLVAYDMFFTGNTIIIDHGLGLISIFAHLKDINVKLNQNIIKGQKIGSIGMTGRATGPHLHWGIYLEKTPVDPMVFIRN